MFISLFIFATSFLYNLWNNDQYSPKIMIIGDVHGCYDELCVGDEVFLKDYTLHQADSVLEIAFNQYYEKSFVTTKFSNKRVIRIGITIRESIGSIN